MQAAYVILLIPVKITKTRASLQLCSSQAHNPAGAKFCRSHNNRITSHRFNRRVGIIPPVLWYRPLRVTTPCYRLIRRVNVERAGVESSESFIRVWIRPQGMALISRMHPDVPSRSSYALVPVIRVDDQHVSAKCDVDTRLVSQVVQDFGVYIHVGCVVGFPAG